MNTPEEIIGKWLADYEEERNIEALKKAWAVYRDPKTGEDYKPKLLEAIDYMIEKL